VILTITTLTELPKLKNVIFNIDPKAFVVVNSTLEVIGKRHGTRKVYYKWFQNLPLNPIEGFETTFKY